MVAAAGGVRGHNRVFMGVGSNLPDTIVIEIISRLPLRDVVRTSSLSHALSPLWRRTRNVEFRESLFIKDGRMQRMAFINFIRHFILQHPHNSLDSLILDFSFNELPLAERELVLDFIRTTMIKTLIINFRDYYTRGIFMDFGLVDIPRIPFSGPMALIEYLELDSCCMNIGILPISPNIRELRAYFLDLGELAKLVRVCTNLRKLTAAHCEINNPVWLILHEHIQTVKITCLITVDDGATLTICTAGKNLPTIDVDGYPDKIEPELMIGRALMGADSEVPDEIMTDIISRLSFKEAAKAFMSLSRALAPLWLMTEDVELRESLYVKDEHPLSEKMEQRTLFLKFVTKLIMHSPRHDLNRLVLDFPFNDFTFEVTEMILNFARTRRIKKLIINFRDWDTRIWILCGITTIPCIPLSGKMALVDHLQLDACHIHVAAGQTFPIRRLDVYLLDLEKLAELVGACINLRELTAESCEISNPVNLILHQRVETVRIRDLTKIVDDASLTIRIYPGTLPDIDFDEFSHVELQVEVWNP